MINDLGLDLRVRPEELTLNQFVELAHLFKRSASIERLQFTDLKKY